MKQKIGSVKAAVCRREFTLRHTQGDRNVMVSLSNHGCPTENLGHDEKAAFCIS
jgi:hypothetical protein